jgi:hypothetical protein
VDALGRLALRHGLIAAAVMLVLALAAGLVRLLPWIVSPEVPLRVSLPFALALAAVAVETAFFVGLPIGFALAAAKLVDRGEARALWALGASPARIVVGSVPHALVLAAFALFAALSWRGDANVPGRFALQLIEQARASCAGAERPKTALVPMVAVTWLCFPGRPPRVVGTLPGFGDRAWFSASELRPSDDLRSFELSELRIVTRKTEERAALRLQVDRARISGLEPWGRPAKLASLPRALLLVATSILLGLLAAWLALGRADASRLSALAVSGGAALAALSTLQAIDKGSLSNAAYALVPAVGLLAMSAFSLVASLAGRLVAGRRGRC